MDDGELRARVKRALERRSCAAKRLNTFYFDIAEAADSSVGAVKNWLQGNNTLEPHFLLNLFENLPGFEAEVRGVRSPPDSQTLAVIEAFEEVAADARKGLLGETRVVPIVRGAKS